MNEISQAYLSVCLSVCQSTHRLSHPRRKKGLRWWLRRRVHCTMYIVRYLIDPALAISSFAVFYFPKSGLCSAMGSVSFIAEEKLQNWINIEWSVEYWPATWKRQCVNRKVDTSLFSCTTWVRRRTAAVDTKQAGLTCFCCIPLSSASWTLIDSIHQPITP